MVTVLYEVSYCGYRDVSGGDGAAVCRGVASVCLRGASGTAGRGIYLTVRGWVSKCSAGEM